MGISGTADFGEGEVYLQQKQRISTNPGTVIYECHVLALLEFPETVSRASHRPDQYNATRFHRDQRRQFHGRDSAPVEAHVEFFNVTRCGYATKVRLDVLLVPARNFRGDDQSGERLNYK